MASPKGGLLPGWVRLQDCAHDFSRADLRQVASCGPMTEGRKCPLDAAMEENITGGSPTRAKGGQTQTRKNDAERRQASLHAASEVQEDDM